MPRHMYGELARSQIGCSVLEQNQIIHHLLLSAKNDRTPSDLKRAALWGLGHIWYDTLFYLILSYLNLTYHILSYLPLPFTSFHFIFISIFMILFLSFFSPHLFCFLFLHFSHAFNH